MTKLNEAFEAQFGKDNPGAETFSTYDREMVRMGFLAGAKAEREAIVSYCKILQIELKAFYRIQHLIECEEKQDG